MGIVLGKICGSSEEVKKKEEKSDKKANCR
jgi:hypothetical protein